MPRDDLRDNKSTRSEAGAERERYSLVLPAALHGRIEQLAATRGTTLLGVILPALRLGLMALEANEEAKVIFREDGEEREVVIIW